MACAELMETENAVAGERATADQHEEENRVEQSKSRASFEELRMTHRPGNWHLDSSAVCSSCDVS